MKKKRQSEPCGDIDNESTESCDDNQNKTSCVHILKAVDLPKVKKALKGGLDVECSECLKNPTVELEDGFEYDMKLWLCFKCGNQGCGRLYRKHALKHFLKPHSDSHALCVNTSTWEIWCYECDDEIPPNSKKKLLEAYEYIKRQQPTPKNSPRVEPVQVETVTPEEKSNTQPQMDTKTNKFIVNLPRVRGLTNLGNTCFFNAVLQCLAQTPFLLSVLKEMSVEGEKFRLPGGTFKYKDTVEELPPIEGELAAWGPLTETLANTLEELQTSGGVYTPKKLLAHLAQKMPQFGGGDQEDSHELLRHLLEAVRTEDLKRYQRVILRDYGIPKLKDPASVDEETTQKIKFYGLQASEMMLRPEHVFRGVLVSTLQCQDCNHTSTREESFLDLSLPIMPDKPQPPIMRRKSELEEENKPSKHQLKKEKKAARKAARQKKPANKIVNQNDGAAIVEENQVDSGESEQSDADVEDNLEDFTKILSTPDDKSDCNLSEKVDLPEKTDKSPPTETPVYLNMPKNYQYYNHVNNVKNEIEDEKIETQISDDKATAVNLKDFTKRLSAATCNDNKVKLNNYIRTSPNVSPNVSLNSSSCSELSSPDQLQTTESRNDVSPDEISSTGGGGLNKNAGHVELPQNTTQTKLQSSPNNSFETTDEKPKIIALGWHEAAKPKSPVRNIFSYNVPSVLPSSYIEDNRSLYLTSALRDNWSSTVGARYQCDDGECSIQSCLNQFTSVELMTGNNKVCCEACTKNINGKDGKNVYTNSTKQLLIASPPAVLILHLKRFQVFRSLFRKMSKPVTFPLVLDLAPFCSNKCKNLPSINHKQNRLLYSLYGIVEHSGTLHGGHYVAYVKVRPTLDENDYRWQFLPRNGSKTPTLSNYHNSNAVLANNLAENNERTDNTLVDGAVASGITEPEMPPGKWYYVSDSQVSEVPETRVLKAQAYLLFYERIL